MERKKRRSDWSVWATAGIVLPLVYLLSIGPAMWLAERAVEFGAPPWLVMGTLHAIYIPFDLFDATPLGRQLMQDYCSLFVNVGP